LREDNSADDDPRKSDAGGNKGASTIHRCSLLGTAGDIMCFPFAQRHPVKRPSQCVPAGVLDRASGDNRGTLRTPVVAQARHRFSVPSVQN
jgi:hypothetical protein